MTQVDFHTRTGDKITYACRLARKVYLAGQMLLVTGDIEVLREFDEWLWTFSALDFIPHCWLASELTAVTPVVLAQQYVPDVKQRILLNLGAALPAHFAHFERVLEIVGDTQDDLEAGRERYRLYREQGCSLKNHSPTN
jgi:DNA polymerase-3 subunit chi